MPTIEQLQRLYDADPSDPFAPYALAQEYAKQGDHAHAVEFYDRCLALDPDYLYAYFHKARAELAAHLAEHEP
jgi:tetratricopeptide (TPR) repeat protein